MCHFVRVVHSSVRTTSCSRPVRPTGTQYFSPLSKLKPQNMSPPVRDHFGPQLLAKTGCHIPSPAITFSLRHAKCLARSASPSGTQGVPCKSGALISPPGPQDKPSSVQCSSAPSWEVHPPNSASSVRNRLSYRTHAFHHLSTQYLANFTHKRRRKRTDWSANVFNNIIEQSEARVPGQCPRTPERLCRNPRPPR